MLVKTFASAVFGIDAAIITIEVNVSKGINFSLVGLPDNAVKESKQRVESAVKTLGYKWPGNRIVINMAPADIRKEGSAYDLPFAIGILGASEQLSPERLENYILMGELSLDGTIHPVKGVLPIAIEARKRGFRGFILPVENAREAAVVDKLEVYGVNSLTDVIGFLNNEKKLEITRVDTRSEFFGRLDNYEVDLADVKGQENVKRALEVAAAGGHNLIMVGPPGAGKTMMAKRLSTIIPPLSLQEALETTKIHSVAGQLKASSSLLTRRPYRAPHHTISEEAICLYVVIFIICKTLYFDS